MANQETNAEQTENLWGTILKEASRSINDRLDAKNVLVLGDRNSGKSTLVTRLQGLDITQVEKGVALGYSFIDIRNTNEADDEPVARLNVWQMEGEPELKELLKFGLNPSSIANCVVVISLDFSQPWNLIESLNKWLAVLQKHISSVSLQLPPGAYNELKNSLTYDFQNYAEPNESAVPSKSHKKKRPVEETDLLPMKEGTLTNNLGVPIIVCCSKTDYFSQLEKDYNYKESHFDYIQTTIRRICLQYGASLVYTSSRKDKNCDILLKYLKHILYGFEFNVKPQLLEKDILFVPIGADSVAKIKVDFDNQNLTRDPDEPFEDIIKLPKKFQVTATSTEPAISAEDDQEFLARHREVIDKDKANEAANKKSTTSPVSASAAVEKFKDVTSTTATGSLPSPTAIQKPSAPASDKPTLPQVASLAASISDPHKTPSSNEHQMLSDFFTSLINKDRNLGKKSSDPKAPTTSSKGGSLTGTSREEIAKQLEKLKQAKS